MSLRSAAWRPARLAELSRRQGSTLFMTLLAAFAALLERYTRQEDLVVGTPIAGRTQGQTEALIGFFVNTLALRVELSGAPSFLELLGRVRETALAAYAHQELPFERLVEDLAPQRDLSRPPLVQALLVVQNVPVHAMSLPGLELRALPVGTETAKFELTFTFTETSETTGKELSGAIEYSRDLFDAPTIERLAGHFARLLAGAVENPDRSLSELPLLSAAEQVQLAAWNEETQRERPEELLGSTLHGLFASQVLRTPEAVALIAGEERLSYGELARRSAGLARYLRGLGVRPEVPVGIFLPRRSELVVALLATHQAGGFYVPLDPAYPAERVGYMLADSGCAVVLTTAELVERLPESTARVVLLDALPEAAPAVPLLPVPRAVSGDLAYVIYTSGSTGRPKAVAIEHRSAVALMLWSRREFSDLELSGVLASTSITFDMSVFELFAPLSWGGTVILAENALALPELPAAGEVRLVDTVPSAMAELLRTGGCPLRW